MALTQRSHWNLLLEQISLAVKAALTCSLAHHWPSYLLVPGEGKAWNTLHKCWVPCRNRCSTDLWIESEDCPIAASWCFLKLPILKESRKTRTSSDFRPVHVASSHFGKAVLYMPPLLTTTCRTLIKHVDLKKLSPESPENGKSPNNTTNIYTNIKKHSKTTTSPTTWSRNSPGISVWTSTHYFRLRSQSRIHCCFQTWHGQLSQQVGALAQDHFSGGNC